jgi:hypothetical protein
MRLVRDYSLNHNTSFLSFLQRTVRSGGPVWIKAQNRTPESLCLGQAVFCGDCRQDRPVLWFIGLLSRLSPQNEMHAKATVAGRALRACGQARAARIPSRLLSSLLSPALNQPCAPAPLDPTEFSRQPWGGSRSLQRRAAELLEAEPSLPF